MPNWPSIEAFVDGVISQTFGEPVVYQPVQAGAAQGSAFTVTEGTHDATNVKVTVTTSAKYKILAWL